MMNKLIVKECKKCGALVKILKDCECGDCGIICCSNEMVLLHPNEFEELKENHIPTYEIVEDEIFVQVNHNMDKNHYIMWISLVYENREYIINLYPEQNAECRFKYIPGSTIYAYCNQHKLWKSDVK